MYIPFALMGINFILSGLFVNFIQLILWLTVKPWNIKLYHQCMYYCVYVVWGQLLYLAEWWSSSTCAVYTDDETWAKLGKEHAILLLNHSYEVDWLISWLMCDQIRVLGCSRAFVKKSLKMIPVIGWTAFFAGNVFLERDWEKDKILMGDQLVALSKNPDPILLHLFAEGTRYTAAKHAASVEFAKKSGRPALKHLLVPRTKGFLVAIEKLRGKFPAVYCATMVFRLKDGTVPTLMSMMLRKPVVGEVLLERIPLEDIPSGAEDATNWVHERYIHKDEMIEAYKTNGRFPLSFGEGHTFKGPIRCHFRPRRLCTLITMLTTSCFTIPPVFYACFTLLTSGIWGAIIGIILLLLTALAIMKMKDLSSASKGSEYGSSPRLKKN